MENQNILDGSVIFHGRELSAEALFERLEAYELLTEEIKEIGGQ